MAIELILGGGFDGTHFEVRQQRHIWKPSIIKDTSWSIRPCV